MVARRPAEHNPPGGPGAVRPGAGRSPGVSWGSVAAPIKTGDYHVVEQGQSVDSLAAACGHKPESIWDAPQNQGLKDQGRERHALHPGDKLFIPAVKPRTESVPTGKAHKLEVKRPRSKLKVRLEVDGKPLAKLAWVLTVDGVEERGQTDGDGVVECPVPPESRQAELTVGSGDDARSYVLILGALDPVSEVSGAQARLANLGYGGVPVDGVLGMETEAALRHFQADQGLDVTGRHDEPTGKKLVELHGS